VRPSTVSKQSSMVTGAQLTGCSDQPAPVEWQFLQCFGERTPGEEVQEGMWADSGCSKQQSSKSSGRAVRGVLSPELLC
jgi:hypothetical protein